MEIETDKIAYEVQSACSGTLLKILVGEESEVKVQTLLAVIGQPGEDISGIISQSDSAQDKEEAPEEVRQQAVAPGAPAGEQAKVNITPRARKLMAKYGLEASEFAGFAGKRITEDDVQELLRRKGGGGASPQGITMLLKDKVAIVTGAAQGIGKAIAALYSEHGAKVVLCDLLEEQGKSAAAEIKRAYGNETQFFKLDITKKEEIESVCQNVLDKYGRIDVLVNNAGILKHSLIIDMKEDDWDAIFRVNVKGTFLFTQAAAKVMIKQKSGKIINISSCSGKKPTMEEAAYCASKSAVIGLTRVTALELGPYGISCNAICPGATDTEMVRKTFLTSPEIEQEWINKTALKRLGKPEDMAKVALFLASGLSDHITGEALIVSAGELMSQ